MVDRDILLARLSDAESAAHLKCVPRFVGFLSESEIAVVNTYLNRKVSRVKFFGGYPFATRQIICFLPDWADDCYMDFPIVPITATFNPDYTLSHRDFLGALMALGITREKVGDIVVTEGKAAIFLHSDIAEYVLCELTKAGRVGLRLQKGIDDFTFPKQEYDDISSTVSSARLDCIISALINASREQASVKIQSGGVLVNGEECKNISRKITDNSVITVIKRGKYIIDSVNIPTKKGRLRLIARKLK